MSIFLLRGIQVIKIINGYQGGQSIEDATMEKNEGKMFEKEGLPSFTPLKVKTVLATTKVNLLFRPFRSKFSR